MSASAGLNAAQNRVLAALLAGATRQEAAASAKKSLRTIERYFRSELFRSEIAARSRQILSDATLVLQQRAVDAATSLGGMAAGALPSSSARVAACRAVLELARNSAEVAELQEAVDALATKLEQRKGWSQ
jgi:vacuolar-type H+-ATPase subunit D/Vma8